jgi:hypothetical protein
MENRKIKLLLTGLILLSSMFVYGQTNQCLRFGMGTGLFSLNYNMNGVKSKLKLGFSGKANYTYFFHPHWGIGTGIEISMSSTDGFIDGAKVSFEGKIDDENDEFRKDIYFRDWHEKQKIIFAEIPVVFNYQYDFGLRKRRKMYINIGAKIQIPLSANYEVTQGELEVQGYYAKWNVTLFGLPNHGFGRESHKKLAGPIAVPLNIAATAAIGFSFEVSPLMDVFLGASFDYGFMNLKSTDEGNILYEDKDQILQYRSILMSSVITKANTIALQGEAGIRVNIGSSSRRGIYRYRR